MKTNTLTIILLAFLLEGAALDRASAQYAETPLDSLRSAADSLARAADSLGALVDSLAPGEKEAPQPEQGQKKKLVMDNPWDGSFGLGLTINRGNSEQRTIISNLRMARKGERSRFISKASVTNSKSDESRSTNKGSFKSKFELNQSKRFFYFGTLDLNYNRQAGLNLRVSPGMGAGVALIAKRKCRLNLNLGANPITEFLRDEPRSTHGYYLGSQDLRIDFNSRTRLVQSITYKPRVDLVQDYLLTFSVSLTNQLTRNFNLELNIESEYNSRPPKHDPPYKRQDWIFYAAVSYSLW